jgi:ammonium transporter Rh
MADAKKECCGGPCTKKFAMVLAGFQAALIIAMWIFTEMSPKLMNGTIADDQTGIYGMFQDVHVMIFAGFAFLMCFLRKYGFSSTGLNMLVSVIAIQWGILVVGFWHCLVNGHWESIKIDLVQLVEGDFAAAACLITMGALLGKTTPQRLILVAVFEIVFYALNYSLLGGAWEAADIGGSMAIHAFGAYFGLAASWVLSPPAAKGHKENGSIYHSDMFAMVGTLFLFIFWPSFVAVPAADSAKARCVVQVLLALCGSCVAAFIASTSLREHKKFDMVDIQNATLAGGVAIGSVADMHMTIGGSVLIGCAAGALSVFGYVYISPWLEKKIGLQDTCGVHNLHGMPGVLGALVSIIGAAAMGSDDYGNHAGEVFKHSSAGSQVGAQIGALVVTLLLAVGGGLVVGKIVQKLTAESKSLFVDTPMWEVPEDIEAAMEAGEVVPVVAAAAAPKEEKPAAAPKKEEPAAAAEAAEEKADEDAV